MELDRWNSICREVLSLNKYRIDEGVGRSRIYKGLKTISGSVSDVKESVSESGFERADALRVRVFAHNTILGLCGVSRTAQSFFESVPEDADLS